MLREGVAPTCQCADRILLLRSLSASLRHYCTSTDHVDPPGSPACRCCLPQLQFAARRIGREMSRRGFIAGMGASLTLLASLGLARPVRAQAASSGSTPPILFQNYLLFDGTSTVLRGGLRLLVEGNRIKLIATGELTAPEGARVIDCGGRVMMPGLIDAHWHRSSRRIRYLPWLRQMSAMSFLPRAPRPSGR